MSLRKSVKLLKCVRLKSQLAGADYGTGTSTAKVFCVLAVHKKGFLRNAECLRPSKRLQMVGKVNLPVTWCKPYVKHIWEFVGWWG